MGINYKGFGFALSVWFIAASAIGYVSGVSLMLTLFQPFEKEEERKELWYVLGQQVSLEVVEDEKAGEEEKEEASEEDREVQKIVAQGREVKRKILIGNIFLIVFVSMSKGSK